MSTIKIAWASDTHLDFREGNRDFLDQVLYAGVDALFITGDIANAKTIVDFLLDMEGEFNIPIYFVLGNHDYYGGSLKTQREEMASLTLAIDNLFWLPEAGVVPLVGGACVCGVDGWYDGRYGKADPPSIAMQDWKVIEELKAFKSHSDLLDGVREIADTDADTARDLLTAAVAGGYRKIYFLTHVPPWKEAAWHMMHHSNEDWVPWFASKATGDVLEEFAVNNPTVQFEVLCGHCHSKGTYQVMPNLVCRTAGAEHGKPSLEDIFFLKDLD